MASFWHLVRSGFIFHDLMTTASAVWTVHFEGCFNIPSAGNQENSNLWNSFANEKTREEEEEMDALLLEAEDESAMDQFLLQAVSENEPENVQPASTNDDDDLFLLDAAQYL